MRTRSGPVLLWLAATAAAITVASIAISQVGRQITLDTPIDEQLAQAATNAESRASRAGEDAEEAGSPGHGPGEPDPDQPAADELGQPGGSSSDPDPPSVAGVVRTYDTIGGSAAIAVSGDAIEVRWATPREGFRVSVEPSASGGEVRVDFRSEAHRSRIKVELIGGQIVEEIEEDDR